ncbi:angiopoietin-related protein 7-like [Drosophila albomicans]|uniref:Angiopoietin-related protein 7-like n=1 Tax=Drosophila albomicans TaxID=7291 RepID=A0A6P8X1M6_DROAB|nr:angiopoietin-related protein 7-like [Drosophila albomicans]
MGTIKIKSVFLLTVFKMFLVATAIGDKTCEFDSKMEEQCRIQSYKTVEPLLDYFRQVRNGLKDKEIKENKLNALNELNSDLMEKYHEIVKIHEKFIKEAALLDEYKNKVMKGENDLQSRQIKVDKLESEINSKQNIIVKLEGHLSDKSTNLKICQDQIKSLNSRLIEKDEIIKRFSENIKNNTEHQKTLELKLEKSKSELIKQDKDIQLCRSEIDTLSRTSENIREQQKRIESQLKDNQRKLIDKVIENQLSQSEIEILSPTTCIPFGENSGVHRLHVSGVGSFDVLCDSQLAGPGWIVIQQRVGGNESFNRDWATYRKGFGALDSDFFLGLEKIHRITSLERHELYIHLVDVNGFTYNARYDDFKISDEDNGYALSLGKFKGTIIRDAMRDGENMQFTTFDRDNDIDGDNCADTYNGWWHTNCYYCNLNAPYGPDLIWYRKNKLKEAKMLIRPIEAMKK